MVDHNQQRIKTRGSREVGDKVIEDLLEGMRYVGLDQGERGNSRVYVGLVLLACGTALNMLSYELCKTWPPCQ